MKQELNLPKKNALCEGAVVVVLQNFVAEEDVKNGSIGAALRKPVCEHAEGPREKGAQPPFVPVNFSNFRIPAEQAWIPGNPTHIPVPAITQHCEPCCCSQTTVL
jgi:hypothetical protein